MSTYSYVKAPRELTPLMRKKLERFFAAFDPHSTHAIEREDALALVRRLSARGAPALRAELEGKMGEFWESGLRGGRRPIRQIEYLAEMATARSDPALQKLELARTLPELADLLFRACASDDAQGRRTFAVLDADADGFLSAKDFAGAVVDFFTSEDDAHPATLLFGSLDAPLGFAESFCRLATRIFSVG